MPFPSSNLVEPVFERTLRLREAIAKGHAEDLLVARNQLKEMLFRVRSSETNLGRTHHNDYLGLSYPLACWIDELMTGDPVAGSVWNESKLEGTMFGTNDRAWMFWRQADLAETLGYTQDISVFYLCVSLGFTGQYSNDPDKLSAWMHRLRLGLGMVPELVLPFANDLSPMTDVPPLNGMRHLRQASHLGWTAAVLMLPLLSYLAVTSWVR